MVFMMSFCTISLGCSHKGKATIFALILLSTYISLSQIITEYKLPLNWSTFSCTRMSIFCKKNKQMKRCFNKLNRPHNYLFALVIPFHFFSCPEVFSADSGGSSHVSVKLVYSPVRLIAPLAGKLLHGVEPNKREVLTSLYIYIDLYRQRKGKHEILYKSMSGTAICFLHAGNALQRPS